MIETFWATLAQAAATMISIFAGFLGVIIVYLKEKRDVVDAEIRNKKLEIADLLSALVSEHVEGSVSFFAGNYDERTLHEATRGMIELARAQPMAFSVYCDSKKDLRLASLF